MEKNKRTLVARAARTKCRTLLGILRKSAKLLPHRLVLMYMSMIRCHMEYCSSLFHEVAKTHLDKFDTIQKIASRIICNAPNDAHAAPLLEMLGLDDLDVRRKLRTSLDA